MTSNRIRLLAVAFFIVSLITAWHFLFNTSLDDPTSHVDSHTSDSQNSVALIPVSTSLPSENPDSADFNVKKIADPESDQVQLSISYTNGKDITELHNAYGNTQLENTVFPLRTELSFKKIFPTRNQEQIIIKSSESLPEDGGDYTLLNIYDANDVALNEIFSLYTQRKASCRSSAQPMDCALNWSATYQVVADQNDPQIIVHYTLNSDQEQSLNLHWNGVRFTDPTGEWEKLMENLIPQ